MVMGKNTWAALSAVFVLGGGLLVVVRPGFAADDDDEKKAMDTVLKIAKALEENKKDVATKQAGEMVKNLKDSKGNPLDLGELAMNGLKLREDGGFGFGAKPGTDPKTDGIEEKLKLLVEKELTKDELAAQVDDLAAMGYAIAAVAHVAQAKGMPTDVKKKDPKKFNKEEWKKWSDGLSKEGLALAELAKSKKATPGEVQAAAKKLSDTCTNCHKTFDPRD
jgi:hypothetical protein